MQIAPEQHQTWIGILARCGQDALDKTWEQIEDKPAYRLLRPIESGMVLLRGRISGSGAPFNFGEATMTRAAVELATGERGFSFRLGQDSGAAERAAVIHALLQRPHLRPIIEDFLIAPSCRSREAETEAARAASAATRVDFFTLVRGDE